MQQSKGLMWFYLVVGLLVGLMVGAWSQDTAYRWVVLLLVAGVVLLIVRKASAADEAWRHGGVDHKRHHPKPVVQTEEELEPDTEEVEVLSPDAAREWLDDLLVQQQEGKKEPR